MSNSSLEYLRPYVTSPSQLRDLNAVIEHGSMNAAAAAIGVTRQNVNRTIRMLKRRAAEGGIAPEAGMTRPAAPGFTTKRVSTAYNIEGDIALQWHIQEPQRQSLEETVEGIKDVFAGTKPCRIIAPPKSAASELATCYIIGDHHFGMFAWSPETGSDDYDTDASERLLVGALRQLIDRTPSSKVGYIINLGDFLHANDSTSTTPASKNLLDTDGRMGRVGRQAGLLMKTIIELALAKHETVRVINSRGNHDPDASLWLNEVCRAYFATNDRVEVMDNFAKFVWFKFGKNLVVTHHGDKINWQRMYQAVTANLSDEWGQCPYRFGWTGHLHHEESKEMGGMKFQRWGVLAPPDAWHAGAGYGGSQRTMSAVVLHAEYGRDSIIEVNVRSLDD